MSEQRIQKVTLIGLFIAFFGAPIIVFIVNTFSPGNYTNTTVLLKEIAILLLGAVMLFIIKQENQTLQSIGIHNKHWSKSILRGFILFIILFAGIVLAAIVLESLGLNLGGAEGSRYKSVSLWTMLIVVFRAGIIEELFYRGYLMERLNVLGKGSKMIFFVIPLVVFALVHYTQGLPGIIISFVAGLILALHYWKTRDLKANMIAHFLGDLLPNVIIPALS